MHLRGLLSNPEFQDLIERLAGKKQRTNA